ncbi:acyl-CoA synthetase [soil metagenome]
MYPGAHAETQGDHPAVVMAGTGEHGAEVMTYAELDAAANRISRLFRQHGVRPGDHVAICLESHIRFIEVLWGCHYAGAIYTAASTRLTAPELAFIVNDCGATVFVTAAAFADVAQAAVETTPAVTTRFVLGGAIDGFVSFDDAVAAPNPSPLPHRVAGSDMLYSSGTTGQPKGVALDFAPAPLETTPGSVAFLLQALFGFTPDDVYLTPAPLYHAAPLRFTMAATALGGRAVIMDQFDPQAFLAAVERHRVTMTQVVPTMFVRLLRLPVEVRSRYDVSTLRTVIHAAAPCPVPVKREIIGWLGPVVHEDYAGTEGNGFVYCNSEQWLAHPGTVGTPLNCTLHICDDDFVELGPDERGTVWFESSRTFSYHNDPDKTAASRHPNGWTTLGDVGYLDDDGYLFLTDRAAYMMIIGGVNVAPQEAENVLGTHPAVADVAVFGIPNEEFGEEVKAVVQPVTPPVNDEAAAALARELIAHCRSQLAAVKCPRTVDFRAELPRHPTGKLYKRFLRDEYWPQATGTNPSPCTWS